MANRLSPFLFLRTPATQAVIHHSLRPAAAYSRYYYQHQMTVLRVSSITGVDHLRNRKHVPCFYRVIETRVEVWENARNAVGTRAFQKLSRVFL